MKKIKLSHIIWIAVIAIIGILVFIRIDFSSPQAMAGPGGQGGPLPVKAIVVNYQAVDDNIIASGTILPNERVELVTEASGKVQRISFREGSTVRKGDLLLQINNADIQAQLRKAEAQLKLIRDREGRQRQMLDRGGISQAEHEIAVAELQSAEADVQLLKAQFDKTQVRAPFSGTIGLRSISEGGYVSSNTPVAVLVSTNPVKIEFSIPERYASEVRQGNIITFRVEGIPEEFEAMIYAMQPQIDFTTRTLKVRAESKNDDGRLVPGSFARVEVKLRKIDDALMVPNEAIVPELANRKVFVMKNGTAVPRDVETGIRTSDKIQVISGIEAGDTVITTGLLQIRPGQKVRVTELE